MKHKSDLKHASMARAREEDKEKKAWNDLRLPKTSCDWPEKSCRMSRVTCASK